MRKILFILLTIFLSSSIYAQKVQFKASAPKVVSVGKRFQLHYTINLNGSGFKSPEIKDFHVLSGPNTSTSSNIQIINGEMQRSVSNTYSFILQAKQAGKFIIGAAKIKVNGKEYKTNTVSIEVVKGANSSAQQQQGTQQKQQVKGVAGKDLFVRVNVDRKSLYQGEHLVAEIKIYSRVSLANLGNVSLPSYNGFWKQELEMPNQITLHRENVNGQIYDVADIKKTVLYPQKSGELVIEPAEIECLIRQKVQSRNRSPFDSFFGGGYQTVKQKIKSPAVKIKVKPLPANKPADFKNAVGSFKLNASIDKDQVITNDAITLKVKISGNGNLKLIQVPKIDFPADFEVYDPKVSSNVKNSINGSAGSKTFEYLIIPRHAGAFTIPPIKFSYFNRITKSYKTLQSKEFVINVEKGENDETLSVVTSNMSKEDVKFIGSDIRFIKTNKFSLTPKGVFVFGSLWFNLAFPIALIIFVVILIVLRKQIKDRADHNLVKHKKANKMAKKRLKSAAAHMKQGQTGLFYTEILKALWGYLGDKLSMPVAELSKESAVEVLINHSVDQEIINELAAIIDNCEYAQFAPGAVTGQMEEWYNKTIDIISKIDHKLK